MQQINPEVQTISTALFHNLSAFAPSADLSTWGYEKTEFPGGYLETIEGTFEVAAVPSIPAGFQVFLNFRVCVTQIEGWDQTIVSENTRAYMHRPDFSQTEELGEQNPHLDGLWSLRSLEDVVLWLVGDSVLILDGWFDQGDSTDAEHAALMSKYQ